MKNSKFSLLFPCKNCLKNSNLLKNICGCRGRGIHPAAARLLQRFWKRWISSSCRGSGGMPAATLGSLTSSFWLLSLAVAAEALCLPRQRALCKSTFCYAFMTAAAEALCLPRQRACWLVIFMHFFISFPTPFQASLWGSCGFSFLF